MAVGRAAGVSVVNIVLHSAAIFAVCFLLSLAAVSLQAQYKAIQTVNNISLSFSCFTSKHTKSLYLNRMYFLATTDSIHHARRWIIQ